MFGTHQPAGVCWMIFMPGTFRGNMGVPLKVPQDLFLKHLFFFEIQILSRLIPAILIGCLRETLNGGKCFCSSLVFSHLRRSLDNLDMFGSVSASGGGETGLVLVVDKCFRGSKDSTSSSKGFPFFTLSPPPQGACGRAASQKTTVRGLLSHPSVTRLPSQSGFAHSFERNTCFSTFWLVTISHLLSLFLGATGGGVRVFRSESEKVYDNFKDLWKSAACFWMISGSVRKVSPP